MLQANADVAIAAVERQRFSDLLKANAKLYSKQVRQPQQRQGKDEEGEASSSSSEGSAPACICGECKEDWFQRGWVRRGNC